MWIEAKELKSLGEKFLRVCRGTSGVCWFWCDVWGATSGWPAAPGWLWKGAWGPAAGLLWDNGWCIPHFSHYRSHMDTHTCALRQAHTRVPISCPLPPSLKGFTHQLIGLNQLWQRGPLAHTSSPEYTTLWNNYSFNWQLICPKSIWPWQPCLETEGCDGHDTMAKVCWRDKGRRGEGGGE